MLLSRCIQGYLEDCYALSPGTQSVYRSHLMRFLRSVGDRAMEDVTPEVVRSFMSGLRRQDGREYSAAYKHQSYRTLNTFFAWSVREGMLVANPWDRVRRPKLPKRKSPRLKLAEVEILLQAVQETKEAPRNLAMVCLMLDAGLRRGEVVGLNMEDVDVRSAVVRVHGKGGRDREVPLGPQAWEALRAYLAVRPAPLNGTDRVFLTAAGTPLTGNALLTLMTRLRRQTGLPKLYCHLLRHTFANHFVNGGGGLRKLQKVLGHSRVRTTADFYTDPELSELQREIARVSPLSQLAVAKGEPRTPDERGSSPLTRS